MKAIKYLVWIGLIAHPVFAQEIISVVPDSASQGTMLTVSITGQKTFFGMGSPSVGVWFSQGNSAIHATSVAVQSNTSLDADFSLAVDAPLGLWDVNVEQIDSLGVVTLPDGFTINRVTALRKPHIDARTAHPEERVLTCDRYGQHLSLLGTVRID